MKKAAFMPKRELDETSQKTAIRPGMFLNRKNEGRRVRLRMKLIKQDAIKRRRVADILLVVSSDALG